jgi:hypothetical protein
VRSPTNDDGPAPAGRTSTAPARGAGTSTGRDGEDDGDDGAGDVFDPLAALGAVDVVGRS